jgi:hypothetical protein
MKNNMYVVFAGFLVLILVIFLLVTYNNKAAMSNSERFYSEVPVVMASAPGGAAPSASASVGTKAPTNPNAAAGMDGSPYGPSDPSGNEVYTPVNGPGAGIGARGSPAGSPTPSCFPRDRLSADDLLPKDAANSRWAQMNPAGQGDMMNNNYLNAGYFVGIDTKGQSLRNANLQLRSEPANPTTPVSPWQISTISPDTNRKQFEIGSD